MYYYFKTKEALKLLTDSSQFCRLYVFAPLAVAILSALVHVFLVNKYVNFIYLYDYFEVKPGIISDSISFKVLKHDELYLN